jgi:predicted regulator of Ras-like GTPase activity (Roadblock/LC7/MglB family)
VTVSWSAALAGDRSAADLAALADALHEVSGDDDAILGGMLVTGADGLVLATEARGLEVDTVAAMTAVVAGIAAKLLERAGVGESKTCLFEGASGHVAVFPMKDDMVLTVFSKYEVTTGLFNLAARNVLARLRKALAQPPAAPATAAAPVHSGAGDEAGVTESDATPAQAPAEPPG